MTALYTPQEITLHTGRKVFKGLHPHTPAYRGRLLGRRSMRAPLRAAPASCLQSGGYYLNMYGNDQYGDCTVVGLAEIINYVYAVQLDPSVVLAWARAQGALQGANEIDILTAAETSPFACGGQDYVLGPSATFDYSDPEAVKTAISANKAAYWGVDAGYLQQCVGDVCGWVAPVVLNPQTNYDHAVFSPDYGTLDQLATYINQQRGVTVTIGSLDPSLLCVTLDTWDTLGIVPMPTVQNTTGEAHAIESFPAPTPAGQNPPAPPVPVTHRLMDALDDVEACLGSTAGVRQLVRRLAAFHQAHPVEAGMLLDYLDRTRTDAVARMFTLLRSFGH